MKEFRLPAVDCGTVAGVWFEVDGFQLDDMRNLKVIPPSDRQQLDSTLQAERPPALKS